MTSQEQADQLLREDQERRRFSIADVVDEMLVATSMDVAEQSVRECLDGFGRLSETRFERINPLCLPSFGRAA